MEHLLVCSWSVGGGRLVGDALVGGSVVGGSVEHLSVGL